MSGNVGHGGILDLRTYLDKSGILEGQTGSHGLQGGQTNSGQGGQLFVTFGQGGQICSFLQIGSGVLQLCCDSGFLHTSTT